MNEQDNRAIVRRGYEAFGRGDIHALLELFDEQVEWVTPGPAELPVAGRRVGRRQVGEFFQAVTSMLEIQRFEPQAFIAEGDRVVVLGSETAVFKATGKTLDTDWAHVFTLRNGVVVAFQEYMDTAAVTAELRAAQARA